MEDSRLGRAGISPGVINDLRYTCLHGVPQGNALADQATDLRDKVLGEPTVTY